MVGPALDLLIDSALEAVQMGDGLRARAFLDQIVAADQNCPEARWLHAKLFLQQGRAEEAFPEASLAVELDPQSADGARLWAGYVTTWTAWNHLRTAAALAAAVLLTLAPRLLLSERSEGISTS